MGRSGNPRSPRTKKSRSREPSENQMLRSLIDHLPDCHIFIKDTQSRFVTTNAYHLQTLGAATLAEVIGKTDFDLFPRELAERYYADEQSVIATKQPVINREEIVVDKKGERKWFLTTKMPLFADDGSVIGIVGISRDITGLKRMEDDLELRVAERTRELQRSEERYHSLFEESKDMVYISTPEGRFVDINKAGLDLFGFATKEEAQKSDIRDLYQNPGDRDRFQALIRRDGYVKDFELTLKRRDGKPLHVLVTANAVKDPEGRFTAYRGIVRDISERKKLEQQLSQVQKMESIGTLAGGIAHDFNNILGGIMGYASLMKAKMGPDHPFRNYVDTIEQGTHRAAELTSKLLAFAMGGSFSIVPVNLNDIILETIRMVSRLFDRSVELKTILDDGLPTVEADPALMQQVVMNLLVNAHDAMPKGGQLIIETRVETIDAEKMRRNLEARQGEYAVISVTDTGIGIANDKIQRIFDPFFSTKEKGKGTGLGLAVTYGAVKNHGGFIRVYSEPGRGSTFRVYLPVSGKPLEKKPEVLEQQDLHGSECILIIDDERDIRVLARDAFEEYGYRVLLAGDGQKGCELFETNRDIIDLVLLDMVMPKMAGLETLLKLKAIDPRVRIILSSGYSKNGKAQEIISYGVEGFIQKPYQIQQLLTLVRNILDRTH